jgi:hypothetical protein
MDGGLIQPKEYNLQNNRCCPIGDRSSSNLHEYMHKYGIIEE